MYRLTSQPPTFIHVSSPRSRFSNTASSSRACSGWSKLLMIILGIQQICPAKRGLRAISRNTKYFLPGSRTACYFRKDRKGKVVASCKAPSHKINNCPPTTQLIRRHLYNKYHPRIPIYIILHDGHHGTLLLEWCSETSSTVSVFKVAGLANAAW